MDYKVIGKRVKRVEDRNAIREAVIADVIDVIATAMHFNGTVRDS